MRLLPIIVLVASAHAAQADRPCERVGNHIAALSALAKPAEVRMSVARRCERDHWATEAQACFVAAPTGAVAERCLDQLTKDQRKQLEGDADRVGDPGFASWSLRRPLLVRAAAATVAMPIAFDVARARDLHDQGMLAYQNGRYDSAIRKFTAAFDTQPAPELIYHMAQAYKRSGQWGNALELYVKYLDVAPDGPAAADCHAQIEKLRDQIP